MSSSQGAISARGPGITVISGTTTQTATVSTTAGMYAGMRILISGSVTAGNNGTFTVTSVPTGTTFVYANPQPSPAAEPTSAATLSFLLSGYAFNQSSICDSSDWTKRLKERLLYNEYSTAGVFSDPPSMVRSNSFRLSYLFGQFKCSLCLGGAFNATVPMNTSDTITLPG